MSDPIADAVRALARLVDERVDAKAEQLVDMTAGIAPALLPRRAAAAYLGVSGSQVDRLWSDGEIEAVEGVGKGRLYTRESLDRLIADRKTTAAGQVRVAQVRRLA